MFLPKSVKCLLICFAVMLAEKNQIGHVFWPGVIQIKL